MLVVFIISLACILYVYFGYPAMLAISSMIVGKEHKKREFYPTVSIIISAYNEEGVIRKKIENLLRLDYPFDKLEIIVASESDDKTDKIVQEYSSQGIKLFSYNGREGKAATLYKAVPQTCGEILVFSDANAMFKPDAIKQLVCNFADPEVGCVSGMMLFKGAEKSSASKGQNAYWRYEIGLKKLSSRLKTCTGGVHGSIFALRREAYLPLNKYRGDDFELTINAATSGWRIVFEPKAISFEEPTDTIGEEFKRKVRIVSWNFESSLMLLWRALCKGQIFISVQLLSHKILRWLVSVFLVLILLSSVLLSLKYKGIYFKVFTLAQLFFYLLAFLGYIFDKAIGGKVPQVLLMPYFFCSINIAALAGVCKSISGKTEILWEKSR